MNILFMYVNVNKKFLSKTKKLIILLFAILYPCKFLKTRGILNFPNIYLFIYSYFFSFIYLFFYRSLVKSKKLNIISRLFYQFKRCKISQRFKLQIIFCIFLKILYLSTYF